MRHPFPTDSPEYAVRERLLADNFGGYKKLPMLLLDNLVERFTSDFAGLGLLEDGGHLEARVEELEAQVDKLAEDLRTAEGTIGDLRADASNGTYISLRF